MAVKILLVENDKGIRESSQMILKSGGYHAVEAVDAEIALSLLERESFDLILLSMTLPDKSGFHILEYLKKNHDASKVIVITGSTGLENAIDRASLGVSDYIIKPYYSADLLKSIQHALSNQSPSTLKLQIINVGDFIKSTPTGDLDIIASRKGFSQIADSGMDLNDYTILIDLRHVKSRLTIFDVYYLASELVVYGKTFRRKTAILLRIDQDIDKASFFELVAKNRCFQVRIFTVFEDAVTWLSSVTLFKEDSII